MVTVAGLVEVPLAKAVTLARHDGPGRLAGRRRPTAVLSWLVTMTGRSGQLTAQFTDHSTTELNLLHWPPRVALSITLPPRLVSRFGAVVIRSRPTIDSAVESVRSAGETLLPLFRSLQNCQDFRGLFINL